MEVTHDLRAQVKKNIQLESLGNISINCVLFDSMKTDGKKASSSLPYGALKIKKLESCHKIKSIIKTI